MTPYKPSTKKGGVGPRGRAKVDVKEDKVRVILREEMADGTTVEHKAFLDKDDCPDSVQKGMWQVSLSADLSKMYGIWPINGMFEGHVKNFAAAKDKAPTPKTVQKGTFSYATFTVIIEILSDNAKGMLVPFVLSYNFAEEQKEIDGKMRSVVQYSQGGKYTEKLIEFLDATGAWNRGPIPYSDNILPKLEKRILEQDKHFHFIMKDGWVSTIYLEGAESEEPEDEKK